MPVLDHLDACASIELACARVCGLLRSGIDPGAPAVGSWTAGDVASHLGFSFRNNCILIKGESLGDFGIEELAAWNATGLARDPERDPVVLADRLEEQAGEFVGLLRAKAGDDPVSWYAGLTLPAASLGAIMLAELLVHGDDLARAAGRRWRIPADDARTIFAGVSTVLPHYVDDAAADLTARIGIALRGGPRVTLAFSDGELSVEEHAAPFDCRISADPVAFLLVSYGRRSMVLPALNGKMFAWGRKPWLGVRLPRLLRKP